MTSQPSNGELTTLFTPGARLGWTFRDISKLAAPYPEPEPDLRSVRDQAQASAAAADTAYARARRWAVRPSLAIGLILVLVAGFLKLGHKPLAVTGATLIAGLILAAPGLGYTAWCWLRVRQAAAQRPEAEFERAHAAWQAKADNHKQAERARLTHAPQWGSVQSPTRRTDIFGGSLEGWQSLLVTHGSSVLATQPLLVLDLSGQFASGELIATAKTAGVPVAHHVLPADLGRCGLLSALTPAQFADALAEAIHAGAPGGARADRAVDVRVLEQLSSALDGDVAPARLAAAAASALGNPVRQGVLSAREQARIGGDLFPPEYRNQLAPNLIRLEAFLADLARHAGPPDGLAPRAAYFTCLALDASARSAHGEMLTALAVQWLTALVSASPAAAPAVIIAGADELTRAHGERLSDACERRQVPLTLMFRHLRDDALQLLGGGTAAFMRLGNHAEAEQAASYLGRQYKFELSQLTATFGGSQTTTRSDTQGLSDSYGTSASRGWQGGGDPLSGSRTTSRNVSTSRNWSTGMSWADGTSFSDASTTQRVYEYAVEPAVLQNLPEHALLLATRGRAAQDVLAVECDPSIAAIPGISTLPLPPASAYAPGAAGAAAAGAAAGVSRGVARPAPGRSRLRRRSP